MKLFLDELGADVARGVWNAADILFTGWLTYAETRAALSAARRAGRIRENWSHLRASVDSRFRGFDFIAADEEIVRLAGDLADRRGLNGYDAVHLATAISIGPETTMVTWDADLARAAGREGLAVAGVTL